MTLATACGGSDPTLPTYSGTPATGSSLGATAAPTGQPATGAPPGTPATAGGVRSSTAIPSGAPSPVFVRGVPTVLVPGPRPWTTLPTLKVGPNKGVHQGVVLVSSVARTAQQRAFVKAYMAYWQLVSDAQFDARMNAAQYGLVATGPAVDYLQRYLTYLRSKHARTVGWSAVHVTEIATETTLPGALLSSCVDNGSIDVLVSTGRPIEKLVAGFDAMASVSVTKAGLRVDWFNTKIRNSACPTSAAA